ncbi:PREDICTED: sporamin B-like [Ipomoea nil]|uniref:sporamin B-like n=1 Tax=Ipomoea nil TaxID=35883 RepID=UPI000900A1A9|nr:PREDICTED: sporamin B-like [Ipomoea nil]
MKALALALLFALSLYLLPYPTHSTFNPIRLRTTVDTPVVDTDGDELRPGGAYYIITAPIDLYMWPPGTELKLEWLDWASKCPSDVLISRMSDGTPITITPAADPNASVVLPSTFVSFKFELPTNKLCVDRLYWEMHESPNSGRVFVKAGEFVSNQSNQFKIEVEPSLNGYRLTYCPFGTSRCHNLGGQIDPLTRAIHLGLNDFPFVVVFKKASK